MKSASAHGVFFLICSAFLFCYFQKPAKAASFSVAKELLEKIEHELQDDQIQSAYNNLMFFFNNKIFDFSDQNILKTKMPWVQADVENLFKKLLSKINKIYSRNCFQKL